MTFLWPELLWALICVPLLIVLYIFLLRRRKKLAVRYAGLSIVKEAMGASQHWRRHIPPALFLLAFTGMLIAMARPAALVTLPSQYETVILAIDVSGSMRASDVQPTRIAAAQEAVRGFVEKQPRHTRIGVVTFAGTAAVTQAPTENREDILAAINRIQLQRATAIGSGILVSLKAIFPEVEFDLNSSDPRPKDTRGSTGRSINEPQAEKKPEHKPVPPGSYTSAAIILLTDGQTTTGPDPVESSMLAAERGVRVFTVGVGTPEGEVVAGEGWSMHVRLDEESLKKIAGATGAQYFYAGTANELTQVYKMLNSKLTLERKETEITAFFAAGAALLALLSALLSMLWFNRIL
ncbi:VWA domain-containing protein [Noviherbaspirillum sp. CPCC 100848]|uniref:VWA domain-containing protein n=1 Tax=Noviherbaspirillum album TaxID=3080276 RepID=A0ABU6JGL1_9BURK|nr:VWA domain-containing protein [Noviherbaspirillum sp. CPCC 100848]MEC4722337.1 VWA domain-containing protein [Noviherbaspirillum sp. CPCC 100848]